MTADELVASIKIEWSETIAAEPNCIEAQILHELSRISNLERQATYVPDYVERNAIENAIKVLRKHNEPCIADTLEAYLRRLPEKSKLIWKDHGNGLWVSRYKGMTFAIQPMYGNRTWAGQFYKGSLLNRAICMTIDEAKELAENWIKK